MYFKLSTIVAVAFTLKVSAAPSSLLTVEKYSGKVVQGSYIVRLKDGVDKEALFASDPVLREAVTHDDWTIIHGFAGQFNATLLNKLRASDSVQSIAEDGVVTIQALQTDAPWGLARLSSAGPVGGLPAWTNYSYLYPDPPAHGAGVDVYVVDTGIYLSHTDFGGRAKFGWTGSGLNQTDDNGHGTHCAGTIAGTRWGVAKGATVISVKVIDAAGSGTLANVVGGFNYVRSAAAASGRPSVASASFGGGASTALDDAVSSLISSGVPTVIAAGNSNVDAGNTSPARVTAAIAVGAIDIADRKASSSNYGAVIDLWAPGVNITSAYRTSTTATAVLSGTSMANSHVAGLAALWLSANGKQSSEAVLQGLIFWSQPGKGIGIPSGTVNRIAHGPLTIVTI